MKPKLATDSRYRLARRLRLNAGVALFCLLALSGLSGAAEARGQEEGVLKQNGKRQELRGVLTSSREKPEAPVERRRLNPEERSALHRDLRDAMRGAYPEQTNRRDTRR